MAPDAAYAIRRPDMEVLATELIHNLWAGTSPPGGLVTDIVFQIFAARVQRFADSGGDRGH